MHWWEETPSEVTESQENAQGMKSARRSKRGSRARATAGKRRKTLTAAIDDDTTRPCSTAGENGDGSNLGTPEPTPSVYVDVIAPSRPPPAPADIMKILEDYGKELDDIMGEEMPAPKGPIRGECVECQKSVLPHEAHATLCQKVIHNRCVRKHYDHCQTCFDAEEIGNGTKRASVSPQVEAAVLEMAGTSAISNVVSPQVEATLLEIIGTAILVSPNIVLPIFTLNPNAPAFKPGNILYATPAAPEKSYDPDEGLLPRGTR